MNNPDNSQNEHPKESRWQRWQRGQALVEYWPALPIGVMVMISAAALVGPIGQAFKESAVGLSCPQGQVSVKPTYSDYPGGHHVEVVASDYDEDTDRTTVTFRVSSGDQPSISHWVLGIDQETADLIIDEHSEDFEWTNGDPSSGGTFAGIKFDEPFNGNPGGGGGNGGNGGQQNKIVSFHKSTITKTIYRPMMNTYVETRDITLVLTGHVDFVEQVDVLIKAGTNVETGSVYIPNPSGSNTELC